MASVLGVRGGHRRTVYNPDGLIPFDAPKSAGDLLALLAATIVEVRSGKLDPRIANSVSCLAGNFLNAIEVADLDSRLKVLEDRRNEQDYRR